MSIADPVPQDRRWAGRAGVAGRLPRYLDTSTVAMSPEALRANCLANGAVAVTAANPRSWHHAAGAATVSQ
jgi:hypothetical protein